MGVVDNKILGNALGKQNKSNVQVKDDTFLDTTIQRKDIRVDKSKLDQLFNLVGELITAESMVINNPDLSGMKLPRFQKASNILNKITREIQEVSMSISMIPVDGLFNKMKRLVRDLSKKIGKKVNIHIAGEDTEMDKNLIEQISDPLVHIIRNAIDHGIGFPDERVKSGKPEMGKIKLLAKYEGNEIWIIIKDDGEGLNREKIINKALEKELVDNSVYEWKDSDIWQLVFEPGFSTAAQVSEVSGRGVGMDVVKKNIEKLRGKIEVISVENEGTEFILKIPLTMAIIDGITVEVGQNLYSIPTEDVLEFFRGEEASITHLNNRGDVIKLREELLPIVKLYEVFNLDTQVKRSSEGVFIVLHNNSKKACLFIDKILGSQQLVIKSLSKYIGNVNGLSGCSILGNGDVSFILDTGSLFKDWVS